MDTAQETGGKIMLYAKKVVIDDENKDGFIQSAGYVPGESGFIIRWNGDVEFNDAVFRGRVEANSGTFRDGIFVNISVSGNSTFEGNIISGPIYASNEIRAPGAENTFPAGTLIRNVWAALGGGTDTTISRSFDNVTHGTKTGMATIQMSRQTSFGPPPYYDMTFRITLSITFSDGTNYQYVDSSGNSSSLPSILVLAGGAGKTLIFHDLPTGDTGLPAGTVWNDNGTLKIVQ